MDREENTSAIEAVPEPDPDAVVEEGLHDFSDSVGKRYDSMILSGKLQTAVRTVTSRGKNGLFKPHDIDEKSGLRVVGVLRSKHPKIRVPDLDDPDQKQAFSGYLIGSDPVPVNCYKNYVARSAAGGLSGAAGLGGVDGETLKG